MEGNLQTLGDVTQALNVIPPTNRWAIRGGQLLPPTVSPLLRLFQTNTVVSIHTPSRVLYNSSHHSAISMLPFKATFGHPPPPLFYHDEFALTSEDVADYRDNHKAIIDALKFNLDRARHHMKSKVDKGRTDTQFDAGNFVLVKLRKYRQNSLSQRRSAKLDQRYFGPF